MRLLQHPETNTVTGAGLLDLVSPPLAVARGTLNKHLQLVIDPARSTATVITPLGTKAVKMPAEVMSLAVRVLTLVE